MAIHRHCRSRDITGLGGGEEDRHIGNVLLGNKPAQGNQITIALTQGILGDTAGFGLIGDDTVHAVTLNRTWADRIDADIKRTQFHGQRLGQPDDAPFGGGIGRPEGIAKQPGGG